MNNNIIKRKDLNNNKSVYTNKSKPIKNVKKPHKRPFKEAPKKQAPKNRAPIKKAPVDKRDSKKKSQVKKLNNSKNLAQKKKPTQKQVKKDVKSQNMIYYKTALENMKNKNDTYKIAEAIMKTVMAKVEKIVHENQKEQMNKLNNITKIIQKRSMTKVHSDISLPPSIRHWKKKYPPKKKEKESNRFKRNVNQTLQKDQSSILFQGK
ncbi:neurofilament heavy polypeptide-like [Leptidea sinapis]|uniref:neurofilament heavy polypeptide-like n=1 Tax=Leptidea sinapis TaxID=189913 RepID=UPI0021C49A81|nr:neurofilament heavy polypeptide-like [Leptidea sinapis]